MSNEIQGTFILPCYQKAPIDGFRSLSDLVNKLFRGKLVIPLHQRTPDAWNIKKQKGWIERIINAGNKVQQSPLGSFSIYALEEDDNIWYLNDGLQRLTAIIAAQADPKNFGLVNREVIDTAIDKIELPVQYRIYKNQEQAVEDFKAINNGTGLVPCENHRGVLVYHHLWKMIWESEWERFEASVTSNLGRFCSVKDKTRGKKLSKERSTRMLFALAHTGKPTQFNDTDQLEKLIVTVFSLKTPQDNKKQIARVAELIAEIETAWRPFQKEKQLQEFLARWCLAVMMHSHQQSIRTDYWANFFNKLFTKTGGLTTFACINALGRNTTKILTTNISIFKFIANELHCPIELKHIRERQDTKDFPDGYHGGHPADAPLVTSGESQVIPQPARLNRSEGARRPIR